MQIDTSKVTGGIKNAVGGGLGMILGQESAAGSRKWMLVGVVSIVGIVLVWKLHALSLVKVWDDLIGLAKFWLVAQGFADGMAAFRKPTVQVPPPAIKA